MTTHVPALAVCGLGRCGTTAVMAMLHAGGIPTAGESPAFEGRGYADQVPELEGVAYKLIDPHRPEVRLPDEWRPRVAIWMFRDFTEQAVSSARYNEHILGGPRRKRSHHRKMAQQLAEQSARSRYALEGWAESTAYLEFGTVIETALAAAVLLDSLCRDARLGRLDINAAAAAVHRRDPAPLQVPWETTL